MQHAAEHFPVELCTCPCQVKVKVQNDVYRAIKSEYTEGCALSSYNRLNTDKSDKVFKRSLNGQTASELNVQCKTLPNGWR